MKLATSPVTLLEIQANRLDLLSRFADALAHEIKNPIHAAVINLELLRRRIAGGDAAPALERVQVLELQIARVHALVDALLQVLRPSREGSTLAEIDRLLQELRPLLEALAAAARVELRFDAAGPGGTVRVDKSAFRHALLNLFANALEAMEGGGRLSLEAAAEAGRVRLCLRDTGPGFDPEILERLGTPGATTRPGRAGLGIAVARALLEEMGGRLVLDGAGQGGEGAAVTCTLPAVSRA